MMLRGGDVSWPRVQIGCHPALIGRNLVAFSCREQTSAKLLENRRVAAQLQLILYVFEVFPSEKSILPSWVECRPLYWVADITVLPICLANKGGLSGTWPGRASLLARCITE